MLPISTHYIFSTLIISYVLCSLGCWFVCFSAVLPNSGDNKKSLQDPAGTFLQDRAETFLQDPQV